ncbi:MAG: hypothetical protein PHC34_03390 [Candidatus Gastranaerophilales bacterium]|nr:hypothetical protein [Candidatus Gastranaerophilales bacterium]
MNTFPISFKQAVTGKTINQIRQQAKQIPDPKVMKNFEWCVGPNASACIKSGVPNLIEIAQKKPSLKEKIKTIFQDLVNSPEVHDDPASPTWLREFGKALDILG